MVWKLLQVVTTKQGKVYGKEIISPTRITRNRFEPKEEPSLDLLDSISLRTFGHDSPTKYNYLIKVVIRSYSTPISCAIIRTFFVTSVFYFTYCMTCLIMVVMQQLKISNCCNFISTKLTTQPRTTVLWPNPHVFFLFFFFHFSTFKNAKRIKSLCFSFRLKGFHKGEGT